MLDDDLLPNLSKVDSRWSGLLSDPHNRFTVAKDAGVTGIVRRKDRLAPVPHTWAEFFAAAQQPSVRVSVSNDVVLVVGLALAALGHSVNSDNSDDLAAAADLLQHVRPYVSSIGASPVAAFSAGRVDLAMADTDQAREIQTSRAAYLDTATTLPRHGRMRDPRPGDRRRSTASRGRSRADQLLLDRVGAREAAFGGGEPGTPAFLEVIRPAELVVDPLIAVPDDVLKGSTAQATLLGSALAHIWSQFTGFDRREGPSPALSLTRCRSVDRQAKRDGRTQISAAGHRDEHRRSLEADALSVPQLDRTSSTPRKPTS